jgi:NADH-quinone oxidoreductase subunit B
MWGSGRRKIVSLLSMWRLSSRPSARVELIGAGLACCALEVEAAQMAGYLVPDSGPNQATGPFVLMVAGTVTGALEPAIESIYRELAQLGAVRVLAFGACSTSGGPYWDAPTVRNGIEGCVPVDSYVPGCPPRPEALNAELERIVDAMVDP